MKKQLQERRPTLTDLVRQCAPRQRPADVLAFERCQRADDISQVADQIVDRLFENGYLEGSTPTEIHAAIVACLADNTRGVPGRIIFKSAV